MSRDNNTEDDAIEIDLGNIGRRIGGFFGKRAGREEGPDREDKTDIKKEGHDAGDTKDAGPKEPEKSAEPQSPPPKEGQVPPAAGKKEPESGEEPSPTNVEKKEAEDTKKTEKDAAPAGSDEDYFEIDLGRLFGRKKEAVAEKKISAQAPEAGPQKAEGTEHTPEPKEKPSEQKPGEDDSIEIDFGKLFGRRKNGDKKPSPEKQETVNESKLGEDEIEIDFGKLFGRKKKEAEPAHPKKHHTQDEPIHHEKNPQKQEKSDDAVEIDLGKIGASISGLFGGKKGREDAKKEKKEEKEEEEYLQTIELDIDSIGKKIIKHRHMVVFLLLAAIVSFSLYIRLLSADSPLSPDYDTYFHYRYARMILSNDMGIPAWDPISYYPPGRPLGEVPGYPLMEAYAYLFLLKLWPALNLMTSSMILTAFLGGLAAIPAYVIAKEASGVRGGLLAAFFVGTLPAILIRTVGAYADTDASVIFFSLSVVALYIKSIGSIKEKPAVKTWAYLMLAIFVGTIFSYTWGGAGHILYIIFAFPLILIPFYLIFSGGSITNRIKTALNRTKYILLVSVVFYTAVFFGTYTLLTGADSGLNGISAGYQQVFGIFTNFNSASEMKSESGGISGGTYGKNVFVSVAEMQAPDLSAYTGQIGNTILFSALSFFILGSAFMLLRYGPKEYHGWMPYFLSLLLLSASILIKLALSEHPLHEFLYRFLLLFSSLFFIAGILGGSKALVAASHAFFENDMQTRIMLLVLIWSASLFMVSTLAIRFIMVLAAPIAIASAMFIDRLLRTAEGAYPKLGPPLLLLAVVLGLALFGAPAYEIGKNARSSMDPNWHDMLGWVKENSVQDATVTTWWDPGHWVTAIAQRRSGADGAHHGGGPYPISVRIADFGYSFATTNETGSVGRLSKYLGNSSEMYYISSNDLIGKFVWLSYFGTGTKQQYVIAKESGTYAQDGGKIHMYQLAQNVALVVKDTAGELEPWLYVNNNKVRIKELAFFDSNGNPQKVRYKEGEDSMVWLQGDMKVAVYMPGTIKDSILTKTYFFGGEGLERFKLIFANQEIKLYQVKF